MHDETDEVVPRSLEEYWAIAWRRRWWILLPLFFGWAIVWSASWFLPTIYRSEALILVEQQKIPEQYVVSNVTISLQDRLQNMTEQILSRTRLQATIDRFGLYAPSHGLKQMMQTQRDAVERMRADIKIQLVNAPGHPGELTAFRIDYFASSPKLAQQVNRELTSLFIEENLMSQQQQSENTTAFLESQLATARQQLENQESKVKAFKAKHFGDLPSQLESNMQILTGLQTQLDNTQRTLDTAKQQKLYLESLQQQYQISAAVPNSTDESPQVLERELLDLRSRLAEARSRYTESYPDVVALRQKISDTIKLQKEVDGELAAGQNRAQPAGPGTAPPDTQQEMSAPLMQVRSQLKANELEIQNYERHAKEIDSQITDYRARLNMTPETEQELADIGRGYEESKANYASLLQKQNQSQLATSLEQRQQGEQFRIIDPSDFPEKPFSPNHFRISAAGLILGMLAGLGLTAFLELKNKRVWKERDLQGLVPGRVLGSIPHLSDGRENLDRLRRWFAFGAAVAMIILMAAGTFYSFHKG